MRMRGGFLREGCNFHAQPGQSGATTPFWYMYDMRLFEATDLRLYQDHTSGRAVPQRSPARPPCNRKMACPLLLLPWCVLHHPEWPARYYCRHVSRGRGPPQALARAQSRQPVQHCLSRTDPPLLLLSPGRPSTSVPSLRTCEISSTGPRPRAHYVAPVTTPAVNQA
ncbi:hypothetical protein P280DRAFT_163379 [Massarina eburnea CBS 473.64]|uniref:Uncharacterized protein n=1 Tax=Massarina eburnea CBS 473.64 TaxID=1395130 RepID=A0A6A6RKE8_9PLEO|nr:hypothetical protein P280DRAFT_163379 [Massarina eburnea CBS 473.64]